MPLSRGSLTVSSSFTLLLLLSLPFSISAIPNPDPNPITPRAVLPTLLARQENTVGSTSCEPFYSILSPCSSATPGILTLPFSLAAQCVCYSSSSWRPAAYDSALATCLSYLSTADPAFYSELPKNGLPSAPCKALGNIAVSSTLGDTSTSGPVSLAGSATITATGDANRNACSSFLSVLASCKAHDPADFTTAVGGHSIFSEEASCLCYTTKSSSDVFAPSIYDGYWGSCLDFYQTASPSFYSASIVGTEGVSVVRAPCSTIGDVRNAGAASSSSAAAATGAVTRPGAGPSTTSASATPTSTALTGVTTTVAASSAKTGAATSVNVDCMLGLVLGLLILILHQG